MSGILITGANGGFGRIFAQALRENQPEPIWLNGRRQSLEQGYEASDLADARATRMMIAKLRPRTIFHLAGNFEQTNDTVCSINLSAAKHLIEALIEERIEARIILMGSAAEYGPVRPDENPINEDRVLRPVSRYGLYKAFQTQFGLYFASNSNLEIVVARMFNLLAPGMSDRLFIGSVEKQIKACLSGEADEIAVGNLDAQRDYVYVAEAIEQLNLIAARGVSGEIYHVASGKPIRMRDLLHNRLTDAGLDAAIVKERSNSVRKGYDVPVIFADMTKTNRLRA